MSIQVYSQVRLIFFFMEQIRGSYSFDQNLRLQSSDCAVAMSRSEKKKSVRVLRFIFVILWVLRIKEEIQKKTNIFESFGCY